MNEKYKKKTFTLDHFQLTTDESFPKYESSMIEQISRVQNDVFNSRIKQV